MKKLIILALFVILTLASSAQMVQDTFFGCKFGISPQHATMLLELKKYTVSARDGRIVFSAKPGENNISFGGVAFEYATFQFTANKLARIDIFTELKEKKEAQQVHDYIFNALAEKHQIMYSEQHDAAVVHAEDGYIRLSMEEEIDKGKKMYYITMLYASLDGIKEKLNEL